MLQHNAENGFKMLKLPSFHNTNVTNNVSTKVPVSITTINFQKCQLLKTKIPNDRTQCTLLNAE